MKNSADKITKISASNSKKLLEEQRFHDVLLLIENLILREKTTFKPIIDCLYDVGSVNFIDRKIKLHPFNKILKLIAKVSKPAFRIIAWRWVKTNCPQLITNWLYTQVKFNNLATATVEVVTDNKTKTLEKQPIVNPKLQSDVLALSSSQSQEIKYLRTQVRLLIGALISVLTVFGGSLFWMSN